VAFHNYRGSISATYDGFQDEYYYGRRPTEAFIPAFRNVFKQQTDFLRGYMSYFSASRIKWETGSDEEGLGSDWKASLTEPGDWWISMGMQGETIPKYDNHVRLSQDKKDTWGIPQLVTSVEYDSNDEKMKNDFLAQGAEMLDRSGCKNIVTKDSRQAPGLDIHEMGGCRMGKDPKSSMLNQWNQIHACKNVFVTDGSCMTSVGNQNPSLTFMAITARAASHAVDELKKQKI
ncbi:MAG TPA: GMC oxidoreductase, partial [Puia sp.]|nr:GMC oxidoreductase [Puia sp.]